MSKGLKTMAVIGAAMVCVGLVCSTIGFALGGGRHRGNWWQYWLTKDYNPGPATSVSLELEAFSALELSGDAVEWSMEPSANGKYGIFMEWRETGLKPSYSLENGVLRVWTDRNGVNQSWNIGALDNGCEVKITYPAGISLDSISIDSAMFSLEAENAAAKKMVIDGSMGDISLENMRLGSLEVDTNMGNLELEQVEAEEIRVDLQMGNCEASGLSSGSIYVDANAGNVELEGSLRGTTEIRVNMGNVELRTNLPGKDYRVNTNTAMGSGKINGAHGGPDAPYLIMAHVSAGNIEMYFPD